MESIRQEVSPLLGLVDWQPDLSPYVDDEDRDLN